MMNLPALKTLLVTGLAAAAFVAQPVTAEARPKHKHGYHKNYQKHYKGHSRYRGHSYRHWNRGRDVYYYGPRHRNYYGPRYYNPYRRSGFSVYLNL